MELRHRSWSDAPETAQLLDAHRAAWVQIDEPKFPSSIRQDLKARTGRPATTCASTDVTPKSGGTTPNRRIATTISIRRRNWNRSPNKVRDVRAMVKKAYLLLNNHFSAQSVANAATLKKMLDEPVTARMPAELVERFPELAGIVATLPRARLL